MRNTVKMGATLMIICLCAAALLSVVYGVTIKKIWENERIANEQKRKIVLPKASRFEEKERDGEIYYVGLDDNGSVVGSIIKTAPRGYGGFINITIGVAPDGSVSAMEVTKLDQKETPGLGAKVVTKKFKEQFSGKKVGQLKVKQDGGDIDAITAATITSRAATNGIREKLEWFLKK